MSLARLVLALTLVGNLPVEEPTRYELFLNLSTARALGFTVPQSVLAQVDEVLQ
jgi:putative tryptophan/tyrosine transport system substrate-binding protein